ncbi:MAG: hypothetical protein WBW99_03465 [Pseudolabrys sp.]
MTQAKKVLISKTLPHFVGAAIITAQQIVCQEKNIILEIFLKNFYDLGKQDFGATVAC